MHSVRSRTRTARRRAERVSEFRGEEPLWLSASAVVAIHEQLVEQFGGSHGVLNVGAVEAAVGGVRNKHSYASAGLAGPAAARLVGLLQNHRFVGRKKRIRAVAEPGLLRPNHKTPRVPPAQLDPAA